MQYIIILKVSRMSPEYWGPYAVGKQESLIGKEYLRLALLFIICFRTLTMAYLAYFPHSYDSRRLE